MKRVELLWQSLWLWERSHTHTYILQGEETIQVKGIRGHVVKNHNMTFEDHKKCLFGDEGLGAYRQNVIICSFKHQLKTIKPNKLTYNNFDDNRIILEDKVPTMAHGHHSSCNSFFFFIKYLVSYSKWIKKLIVKNKYGIYLNKSIVYKFKNYLQTIFL